MDRRGFLSGSGSAAIGVTVVPITALTTAPDLHAQVFSVVGADVGKTLICIALDVFPHDRLGDKYYAAAVASAKDSRLKSMLSEIVALVNKTIGSSKAHINVALIELPPENIGEAGEPDRRLLDR